jgi:hypothetical protein
MAEFTKEQMAQIQAACAEHIANCLVPMKLPNMDAVDEFAIHWWTHETDQPIQTAVEEGTMSCFVIAVLNRFCQS